LAYPHGPLEGGGGIGWWGRGIWVAGPRGGGGLDQEKGKGKWIFLLGIMAQEFERDSKRKFEMESKGIEKSSRGGGKGFSNSLLGKR